MSMPVAFESLVEAAALACAVALVLGGYFLLQLILGPFAAAALAILLSHPTAAPDPFYPERAQRLEREGEASVECRVLSEKRLEACKVVSESPPGWGFGEAAVHRLTAPNAGIDPVLLKGRTTYRTRVTFRLTN